MSSTHITTNEGEGVGGGMYYMYMVHIAPNLPVCKHVLYRIYKYKNCP